MCENIVMNTESIRENVYHIGKKIQLATEIILGTFDATICTSLLANRIQFCDTTTINNDRTTPYAAVDILEENNNDPNNNLDSIQSNQEQENQISIVPDEIQRAEVAECESDQLPDCSKDVDKKEYQYCDNKLQQEALKIHGLLPQFDYKQIFATLSKNHFAENRILLTLWDLLPSNRPMALLQLVHKNTIRNYKSVPSKFKTDDHADPTFENNEVILIENKNQNNAEILKQYSTVSPIQDENFQNTGAIPKKKASTQSIVVQNRTLQTGKLMINKKISEITDRKILVEKNSFEEKSKNCDKHTKLNKYMEYLEFMKNVKKQESTKDFRNINFQVRNSIRQFFLHSKLNSNVNISQFIKENNKSKVFNIADTNSNNDKQCNDKKQVCALFKDDTENLQYSNDNTSISGSSENLYLLFENEPTVAACKNSNAVSSCSTSNDLPIDTVDTLIGYHINDIKRPHQISLNRILSESSVTSSVETHYMHDKEFDEISICTAYDNPNNSNISNSSKDQDSFEEKSKNCDKHTKLNKYMKYLEYMKNVKKQRSTKDFRNINFQVRNSIRQFFLHSKLNSNVNISQFIKENNKSKVFNIADTNSNNDKQCNDKKQVCALFEDDTENLQYSNDNTSISGSSENLYLLFENEPTVAACKNSNAVSSCSTSNDLPIDTVDTLTGYHINDIERPHQIPLNKILSESSVTSSLETHYMHDKEFDETSICTAYDNPNNSNILKSSTDQASIQENKFVLSPDVEPIYNNLLSVFPDIDEDYSKKLCSEYFEEHNSIDGMLEDLIDHILEHKEACPIKKYKHICKEETFNINQQTANLCSIFPDADEAYLKKHVQLMKGNQNDITNFIQTQCNNPTYITKEENLRRMKITQFQKQYIQNFNVEAFLELLPDPFEHFENVNRQCNYNDEVLDFLKSSYNCPEETLEEYYKNWKYNLSLTAKALDQSYIINDHRTVNVNNIHDIPLLQECAFVLHKIQISSSMNLRKKEENTEFEKLKRNNNLWECENCYDDECMPSKCFTCNDGHIFCKLCVITAVKVELEKGNTHVKCFSLDCNEEFSSSTLQKALPPTDFSILLTKRQEMEVTAAGLEGLVSCPFCSFVSIPPPEDKVFKCLHPDCMKESCRLCKMLNHVPLECEEITKKSKARLLLEEKMTEALVRKCYNCRKPYIKMNGCNSIHCSCGARMCYVCEEPITCYSHFKLKGCPQYSNDNQLHNDTINAVANKTLKYIAEKNIEVDEFSHLLQNAKTTNFAPEISKRVSKIANFNL